MPQRSPTLEGFRAVTRLPSLGLAEIIWRWTFGLAACALVGATVLEYLNTLAVTPLDLLLFRSRQPVFIGRALARIFAGSGSRLLEATLVLVPALAIAWIVAASVGRAAVLKAILGYFGQYNDEAMLHGNSWRVWRSRSERWRLRSLLGLNFLRAGLALAAVLGFFGAAIVAGFATSDDSPQTGLVFLIFLVLALMVWAMWSTINWFLSTAAIFVIRDGCDAFAALGDTVLLCRDRFGPVFAAGSWSGLFRLLIFGAATVAACFPIALATAVPRVLTWFGILLITLVYFAVADYLYVARLAAYVYLADDSHWPPVVAPPPTLKPIAPVLAEPTYDPDDLILSDLETAKGMA